MDLTQEPPPEEKPQRRYYFEEEQTAPPPAPPKPIQVSSSTWKVLVGLAAGLAFLVWNARLEPVDLPPIVAQLYTEPGPGPLSPEPVKEKKASTLPPDWQQRFQPKPKTYPVKERVTQTESDYRQINRYELLPEVLQSRPKRSLWVESNRPVPRPTQVHDKGLVLAGRGFEIGRFEPDKGLTFRLNTLPIPEPHMMPLDELPEYGNETEGLEASPYKKGLLFHAGATGLPPRIDMETVGQPETLPPEQEEEQLETEPVPERRVLLDVKGKTMLKLNPSAQPPLDLLNQHPAILRHQFDQRETRPE
ncbi:MULTISPECIES: hypothetical protein [unclassified Nitrospina]|uniref:hypothetical protein n=1 Tax=unclassified Nitrospina TaxID=2638683 RepID=UPI003F9B9ED1